jgi:hypothetical protein
MKLSNIGVNPWKDLDFNIVTHAELEEVFRKREQDG